jgi:heme/copper-type cytochrome/quinol oxidase subunit 3
MNPLTDREDAALNGVNAALGVILLISPWLLGFAAERVPTWTALIGGAVIAAAALAAFTRLLEWEEWVNLVAGLCIAVSPWVLGFTGLAKAAWTHIIVGVLVALLAAIELWRIRGGAPPARPV